MVDIASLENTQFWCFCSATGLDAALLICLVIDGI
jgi:hypothetical protein